MKLKSMIAAALAALTLAACSKDGSNDPGGKNGVKTHALITISENYAPAVRADEDIDAVRGEGKMNDITLYIFDGNKNLESIVEFSSGQTNKVIETTSGPHYFTAAINKPSSMPSDIAPGQHMSVVEAKILAVASMGDIASNDNFFMTNVEAPEVENLVEGGSEIAPANNVEIKVGRAMAKVNLTVPANVKSDNGDLKNLAAGDIEYMVASNPNRMHLFPVYDGGYLKTPYFDNVFADADAANYFPAIGSTDKYDDIQSLLADAGTPVYAMENSNASVPKFGESSYILMTGIYKPAKWYDADGVEDTNAAQFGDDFYRIGVLNSKGRIESYTERIYSQSLTEVQIKAELNVADASGYSVDKYEGGRTYYPIWLEYNDISTDFTAKYTVSRNTYFYVTVNEITGPGYSKPDLIPDPELPMKSSTWIDATITPVEWTVVSQGAIVGN